MDEQTDPRTEGDDTPVEQADPRTPDAPTRDRSAGPEPLRSDPRVRHTRDHRQMRPE